MKKPTKETTYVKTTMLPVDFHGLTPTDVAAIKAVMQGGADSVQQVAAIKAIVDKISGYYHLSYRPDELGGSRASDFLEGRRFVGKWILNLQTMPTKLFEKDSAQ